MTDSLDIPGLTHSNGHFGFSVAEEASSAKLIVLMVGLPARGKSYTVKKLARYLNWLQHKTRIFNAGDRRRTAGAALDSAGHSLSSANFFDPESQECVALRDKIALDTLDELLHWMKHEQGSVGILDATNSTVERRQLILQHIQKRVEVTPAVLFLESSCYDASILEKNILLKLSGPDYRTQDPMTAIKDFKRRIANYERSYVPLGAFEEKHGISYIQMIDVGRQIRTHLIRGFLSTQLVEYLLNFHLEERQIWLTCNGESVDDEMGRIGRSSNLSVHGRRYAKALESFIKQKRSEWHRETKHLREYGQSDRQMLEQGDVASRFDGFSWRSPDEAAADETRDFGIWTSMMPQAIQTVAPFSNNQYTKKQMRMLNDLHPGHVAGLTFKEIAECYPEELEARRRDRLLFRWSGPGGEGYVDVINRLRAVIVELERVRHHILLVTHRAVVRVLLAYFLGLQRKDLPEMKVPKDHLFCLEPRAYGIEVKTYKYAPETETFESVATKIESLLVNS